jgi:DNA-binding NarL/FixJ family response regulator
MTTGEIRDCDPHRAQGSADSINWTAESAGDETVTGIGVTGCDIGARGAAIPGSNTNRLRILLVDDHLIMREALKALLGGDPKLEIVGEAGTAAEALWAVEWLRPSVVVLDVSLPDRSGLEVAAELRARASGARVLMLSAHVSKKHVVAALKAGALGYVLKDANHRELREGLYAVGAGQMFLCVRSGIETCMHRPLDTQSSSSTPRGLALLTPRERQVLEGIAHGGTNRKIARALVVSVKTVEKHRGNLMRKLNLHNIGGLTLFAIRQGLVRAHSTSGSPLAASGQ